MTQKCDLHDPCVICNGEVCRTTHKSGTRAGKLESIATWLAKKVCSPECRSILRHWTIYVETEERKAAAQILIDSKVIVDQYIYGIKP